MSALIVNRCVAPEMGLRCLNALNATAVSVLSRMVFSGVFLRAMRSSVGCLVSWSSVSPNCCGMMPEIVTWAFALLIVVSPSFLRRTTTSNESRPLSKVSAGGLPCSNLSVTPFVPPRKGFVSG